MQLRWVLIGVVVWGGVARAAPVKLPDAAKLTLGALYLPGTAGDFKTAATASEAAHYFNRAHCQCAKASAGPETAFQYGLVLSPPTEMPTMAQPASMWVGGCTSDVDGADVACRELATPKLEDLYAVDADKRLAFTLSDVLGDCQGDDQGPAISLRIDVEGKQQPVLTWQAGLIGKTGNADVLPPPLPEALAARASDGAIVLTWKAPAERASDVATYQALCADASGAPVTAGGDPAYRTAAQLCARPQDDAALSATDNPAMRDGDGAVALPPAMAALDQRYLCGGAAGGATTLQIGGLTNGTPYTVALVASDAHGNYTGTYFTTTITPATALDFWDDVQSRGGDANGGFCLLAETYGDDSGLTGALRAFRDDTLRSSAAGRWLTARYYATFAPFGAWVHGSWPLRVISAVALAPVVAFALLWHLLTLPGALALIAALWWLRRRGPRVAARFATRGAAIATVLALHGSAHAGGYQPYWEGAATEEAPAPLKVSWHAGIRVGPYLPDVDGKLGLAPGPFGQMFGGPRPMPMFDLDRIVWRRAGQIAIGISAGYMQWFGHAFIAGSDPTDPMRTRGRDANTFRLIPLSLNATYRLTWLDDERGIPVVPYVRGGLAYDIWWLKSKHDHVCADGGSSCAPRGGSLGVQGAIGVAIRAERVDSSSAISMHQSGIQHAGIYGELSMAKVDGFGADGKLSLGDRTWSAGVDFEF